MRVLGLGTSVPPQRIAQVDAVRESAPLVCGEPRQERILRALFERSGVSTRHSVVLREPDTGGAPTQEFYPPARGAEDRGPGTEARMLMYERHSADLAAAAGAEALGDHDRSRISHVVTVSCTGFHAPGLDVALVERLGLPPAAERTHVGFMGCHGLFNAMATARALTAAEPAARVLVCATELCSLHFHYGWDSDRLVANALFADGAAAALCAGGPGEAVLHVEATGTHLFADSADAMSWRIGDHGFVMTLSPRVPTLIRDAVPEPLTRWLARHDLTPADIPTWAVHPGGPRILTAFEQALALPPDALATSRDVLSRYGNMSSATIGFILGEMVEAGVEGRAVAVGFGPGLVGEWMLVRFGDGGEGR